jgi:hypothetical protein
MKSHRVILSILLALAARNAPAQNQPIVDPATREPMLVQLDASGIESKFVNPVAPVGIDKRPLQFFNNTGDRIFVVTIPFRYTGSELTSAYAVADYDRGRQVVSEIVCNVLERNGKRCAPSTDINSIINPIDKLEGLRVLLEAVSNAKPVSLADVCDAKPATSEQVHPAPNPAKKPTHLKNGSCVVETLFWTANCQKTEELLSFAHGLEDKITVQELEDAVATRADEFVKNFFEEDKIFHSCSFEAAKTVQTEIVAELEAGALEEDDDKLARKKTGLQADPSTGQGKDDAVAFSYEVKSAGLKARFDDARVNLAKKTLTAAIREEMDFLEPKPEERKWYHKLGLRKAPARFTGRIKEVFEKLEETRDELIQESRRASGDEKGIYECKLREVEAAGKLLASYGPDAVVPYSGLPYTVFDDKLGADDPAAPTNKDRGEQCVKLAHLYIRRGEESPTPAQMMRSENSARVSEQGIEITGCSSDGTATTCAATATIYPYQRATFSPAMLQHHPQARIRFTVAFFGETEVPANANGYVLRVDAQAADEKPKSEFNIQFGGDATSAREPDKAAALGLRHTGATGTLGFIYTGPVEASATVQYKTGDFGGDPASTKLDATQYQAKVFGPKLFDRYAMTLQYGKLPFARPSSGIAVNVFGEGAQFAVGSASLGYVVLRESDNPELVADTQNDDSDLWMLQIKSIPLFPHFLRTLDLIALLGEDRKDDPQGPTDTDDDSPPAAVARPFTYRSYGLEARWGWPNIPTLNGSVAWYRSHLNVDTLPGQLAIRRDGRGTVWLARASYSRLGFPHLYERQPRIRPKYGFTAFLGRGTGDDKGSPDDEGYLGENAGYTNDVLFLSKISRAFPDDIGIGLANKWYGGLQYTEERWSLLAMIARIFKIKESDIESMSTIVTAHGYEFVRPVHGRHRAGEELDLSFNLEAPKNIRWSLGGAYYWPSPAVDEILEDEDLWSASLKLAITLSGR